MGGVSKMLEIMYWQVDRQRQVDGCTQKFLRKVSFTVCSHVRWGLLRRSQVPRKKKKKKTSNINVFYFTFRFHTVSY